MGFGARGFGSGFWVLGFGFWVLGFGGWVLVLGFGAWDSGFGVSALDILSFGGFGTRTIARCAERGVGHLAGYSQVDISTLVARAWASPPRGLFLSSRPGFVVQIS